MGLNLWPLHQGPWEHRAFILLTIPWVSFAYLPELCFDRFGIGFPCMFKISAKAEVLIQVLRHMGDGYWWQLQCLHSSSNFNSNQLINGLWPISLCMQKKTCKAMHYLFLYFMLCRLFQQNLWLTSSIENNHRYTDYNSAYLNENFFSAVPRDRNAMLCSESLVISRLYNI